MDSTRQLLLAERERVQARLAELTGDYRNIVDASRDDNADDEHDPEGATIAFERSQVATVIEQTRRHLDELDAAVARVDAGTYGVCERCGRTIPAARLEARPVARTCVSC
ncbi:TraR/DksA family transcriptional regulator [Nocardioides panacisoli]|uniref:TraR/DksA family transcriptional regulator n=1 Tax=Nocardioides panacisoli TaxID=627624 RepID=UPI001C634540|nr:TraR/DksA C4-type zinc finger protein [Nocardioides panacisoli]QYJ03248.1 TraR/DksA family transcriptional regulator [Nocardioides panacisoli]